MNTVGIWLFAQSYAVDSIILCMILVSLSNLDKSIIVYRQNDTGHLSTSSGVCYTPEALVTPNLLQPMSSLILKDQTSC